ncbi:MAG: CDP-alcohol phosphatidyltransferase family protein [Geodermatophilaceae bacterium]|jgi:CDP-diacylglycerol--glycerol-3-phosphate 3-phosphatidyltransferase|nr:CDP-alcohol phosphatidyltransferase family protein [Geodermatophilaceae bacterium]MDQ3463735.1 CDP-alcohol phosphatidyltransferase family protein [Actinomycetota bacterium]
MLNILARTSVAKALQPLGERLARAGVSPNAVTVTGTLGAVAAAVAFLGRGQFLVGTIVITIFVLFDLVDGALARARGRSSPFGAVLDSTCDRIVDAAIFGSLVWWYADRGDSPALLLAAVLCLALASLTSYVKARAEGAGLRCDVGIAERAERLIVVLVGTGLEGIGVPFALAAALWLLVAATAITVVQRIVEVRRQAALVTPQAPPRMPPR